MMFLKETYNKNGITLISLVITIIIILILAGILVYFIIEGNGIINNTQIAKYYNSYESLKEEIRIVMTARKIDNSNSLKKDLERSIGGEKTIEESEYVSDLYYVTRDNVTITVYEDGTIVDGKVSVWDGTSKSRPHIDIKRNWHIKNAEELKFFADYVNGNLTEEEKAGIEELTSETIVYLENNIDLGARIVDNTWENDYNESIKWNPIAKIKENCFNGIFEGNNHNIRGIYVNEETKVAGLFGYCKYVENLSISDSYIKGLTNVGGLAGIHNGNIICNVHNNNTIVTGTNQYIGGIVGQTTKTSIVYNCSNFGDISGYDNVGGIIGVMQGNINNCINSGNINGANSTVAGIVGWAYMNCTIEDCYNSGNIESKYRAAGISGSIGKNSKVKNCDNTGNIIGSVMLTGGITGQLDISCEISNCNNKGKIVGVQYVSGIIGYSRDSSNIEKCINTGIIEGTDKYTGGIIGLIATDSNDPSSAQITKIQKNCNIGKIKGNKYTGGIVGCTGQYGSVVEKCYNTEEIEGTENVGGIIGCLTRSSKAYNCYNMGNVTGSNYIGGISGGTYYSVCQINNCYNTGNITGQTIIGGIIGKNENESTIENSYYLTGTALLDSGNIQESNLSKDKEFITTTFVTQANNEDIIWIVNSNQNNGYPILIMD